MMKILYIGNDLSKNSKYHSAYATLKINLINEGYTLTTASSQKNQILRLLDIIWTVLRYGKKVDFILIDAFSTSAFYFAFISSQIARAYQTKYIPILHGGDLPKRLEASQKMSKMMFGHSYINVAPSTYLQKAFQKKGYTATLIPNTIDIKEHLFKKRTAVKPNLLYVRAFAKIYNPVLAIRVLKRIQKTHPAATLCMVGPDRDGSMEAVENEIKRLNLQSFVTLTGVLPKSEWHQLSENYDIFINTTNVDNTPVSLIETMALGLPIVSTNVGGIPDLMDHEIDCFLVRPNDEIAMGNAVLNLVQNTEIAKSFSVKGRQKAESFDWSVVKFRWQNILS